MRQDQLQIKTFDGHNVETPLPPTTSSVSARGFTNLSAYSQTSSTFRIVDTRLIRSFIYNMADLEPHDATDNSSTEWSREPSMSPSAKLITRP
jgi:hypothetical protein